MIVYVNGDSHSAAAEAVNSYAFAEDAPRLDILGRRPHPANIVVSYGKVLADSLSATFVCDAESASSNDRIIRTTREYLKNNTPDLIVIGWSTWEREEWLVEGTYWQINAGGPGHDWPNSVKDRYKQWITSVDYKLKELENHNLLWDFHCELTVPHLFFNTFNCFSYIRNNNLPRHSWGDSYLDPYDEHATYYNWLKDHGFNTVRPDSYHFGADAHAAWAKYLLTRLAKESIITT